MIKNPRPTRAETSDVANAIFEGTDAIMLSAETSVGAYPFDAVKTMSRIAETAEKEVARRAGSRSWNEKSANLSDFMCKGAWLAARELNIRAILVPTSSGRTAQRMSRHRPIVPILATSPDMAVGRRLSLSFGVYTEPTRHYGRMENMVRRSCQVMVDAGKIDPKDLVAVVCRSRWAFG